MTKRPAADEFAEYYANYIDRVQNGDIVEILDTQISDFDSLLSGINESTALKIHQPYTWTIKQVVGHIIDVERVFSYRALRWASGDVRPIVGMEQNEWVDNTDWTSPTLNSLNQEFTFCRRANVSMFRRLNEKSWDGRGEADGNVMSARAAAYCMAGHVIHHSEIIRSRIRGDS